MSKDQADPRRSSPAVCRGIRKPVPAGTGPLLAVCLLAAGVGWGQNTTGARTKPAAESLSIRLFDPSGKPVQGAKLGNGRARWDFFDTSTTDRPGTLIRWNTGSRRLPPAISDASGTVVLPHEKVFSGRRRRAFYALHSASGLVGLRLAQRDDPSRQIEMKLQPACHVFGRAGSVALKKRGIPMLSTYADLGPGGMSPFLYHHSSQGRLEFLLPSGEYDLRIGGWGKGIGGVQSGGVPLQEKRLSFSVKPGQRVLDLGAINLEQTDLGALVGEPAPELQGIRAWKNTKPLKLADLKGKVVVLEFWGYWCGMCVGDSMPWLFGLHDRYAKDGLVIIAVHDDSRKLRSLVELEEKLKAVRTRLWRGREVPFPVAMDAGGGRGSTHRAYHIERWPTTLLIDRQGRLVHVFRCGAIAEVIEKALAPAEKGA